MVANTTVPAGVTLREDTLAFLNNDKQLLINGEWVAPAEGGSMPTLNPANGETLLNFAIGTQADVDKAVDVARRALHGAWGQMTGDDRGRILWKIGELIEANIDMLAELETLDSGKPLESSKGEISNAAAQFRYFAGWASKIEGSTIPVSNPDELVYTIREPMGVVGIITPWNFPLLMVSWKLPAALATGNTVILKPAEQTPLTALALGNLALEAGLPPGVFNIITGPGDPTGNAITHHMGIDKVAFTGSTGVGRKIMAAAANSNLKRVSLELGGKSPHVIFADADLEQAVGDAQWGVFYNTGQECTSGTRLFVQRPAYDEIVERFKALTGEMTVGNGLTNPDLGPMISERQLNTVMGYIKAGVDEGAEVITGAERIGGDLANGYFLQPTVFAHQNDSLTIVREEIFGPVQTITAFDDWDDLIPRVNNTVYGLAAGIWTSNLKTAHRFAAATQAGTIWINGYAKFDPAAPFGGMKQSGFGREMGKDVLELYTQTKTVWVGLR